MRLTSGTTYPCHQSEIHKKAIVDIAYQLLDNSDVHQASRNLLELYIDEEVFARHLYSLPYCMIIIDTKDLEFLVKISKSKSCVSKTSSLIELIKEKNLSVVDFTDIIFNACENVIKNAKNDINDISTELYGVAPDLSNMLALLYDKTPYDEEARQKCLDLWDAMYENRIGTTRELTHSLMSV